MLEPNDTSPLLERVWIPAATVRRVYPTWIYYPRNTRPPQWASDVVEVVAESERTISTVATPPAHPTSDDVLRRVTPGLSRLGYAVETGKTAAGKIRRPVFFGENGEPSVSYEIDAFHDEHGVVVEVEAGRGAMSNAVYRNIVRTSLILDARYLVILIPQKYVSKSAGRDTVAHAYETTKFQFDAIYASDRLKLPFVGVLLIGY